MKGVVVGYFAQGKKSSVRSLEENNAKSLQKHRDVFAKASNRLVEDIAMKNRKTRK
jgi:hypothetical protein